MAYRAPVSEIHFALMQEAAFSASSIAANMKICRMI